MKQHWIAALGLLAALASLALPGLSIPASGVQRAQGAASGRSSAAPVWLAVTVSPLVTTTPPRQLVLTWAHAAPQPGDWIGLFEHDPALANGSLPDPIALEPVTSASGEFSTGVQAPPTAEEVTQCAGYIRGGAVLASECARMHPDWMAQLRQQIGPLRLRELLIPGTHDSGAYRSYRGGSETLVVKYTITQEDDVLTQLLLGARYLDIRVGHYPATAQRWWVNHGVARLHPMEDVIEDVRTFLRSHPDEIIIFDVQEFPVGFGPDLSVHRALVAYLTSELSDVLVPTTGGLGWSSTLDAVWSQRGRVILAYDRADVISELPDAPLWSAVRQLWGDVRTLDDLRDYLHSKLGPDASPQTGAHAAMAELTPSTWDVFLDALGGLRAMAAEVDAAITTGLRDEWAPRANAFAVDFIRGTDVVRVAIDFNRRRGEALLRKGRSAANATSAGR